MIIMNKFLVFSVIYVVAAVVFVLNFNALLVTDEKSSFKIFGLLYLVLVMLWWGGGLLVRKYRK